MHQVSQRDLLQQGLSEGTLQGAQEGMPHLGARVRETTRAEDGKSVEWGSKGRREGSRVAKVAGMSVEKERKGDIANVIKVRHLSLDIGIEMNGLLERDEEHARKADRQRGRRLPEFGERKGTD